MQIGRALRYEQVEKQLDRLAVGRLKRNGLIHADHCADRFFQTLDAPVWNGDALSKTGRSELLPRKETIGDLAARDMVVIFERQSCVFENALLTADIEIEDSVLDRD